MESVGDMEGTEMEDPEVLESLRMKFLRGYLAGVSLFLVLWFTRFFFRASGLNSKPAGLLVLAGLIASALVFSYFLWRLSLLNARISKDPAVGEAVNNELFQYCALRAWKPAFIGSVATTLVLAMVQFAYPVIDLVFVALSSIVTGAFCYLAALYLMCRSS